MCSLPPPFLPPLHIEAPEILGQRSGVQTGRGYWQGRSVFFKRLLEQDGLETMQRFWHEAQVCQLLAHPLFLAPLATSEEYLIFPYQVGGTLRDLARCGPLPVSEALNLTLGILEGVCYLHSAGITHHDLKPENILLAEGKAQAGAIRIIDFGMSHAKHLELDIHSGTRMGTPHFMAPEQFRGVRGDPRSDLYSVGVLLFDCLAGHPPYEDALGWLLGSETGELQWPGPAPLHPLMQQAMRRLPEHRFQTAEEMKARVQEALLLC